jgi:hypothetical protein
VLAAAALPAPAGAAGPTHVVIRGQGHRVFVTSGFSLLITEARYVDVMSRTAEPDAGAVVPGRLGPRFVVEFRVALGANPSWPILRERVYPLARGGPLVHVPPQAMTERAGWYRAGPFLQDVLARVGFEMPPARRVPGDLLAARDEVLWAFEDAMTIGTPIAARRAALEGVERIDAVGGPDRLAVPNVVVDHVRFVDASTAAVLYRVVAPSGERPGGRIVEERGGHAVYAGGRWKVALETSCAELARQGVDCAPFDSASWMPLLA